MTPTDLDKAEALLKGGRDAEDCERFLSNHGRALLLVAREARSVIDTWEALYPSFPRDDRYEDADFGPFLRLRSALASAEGRS